MAVTVELEAADESEPDNTDSNQHLCPFCSYNYAHNPASCEHLLCTVEFVESNNELVVAPDHPIVASLYGLDVPRVVAVRFMQYLRTQARGALGAFSWDNAQGVRTTDLLAERRSRSGVVSIKYTREDESSFREWTYYLTAAPAESMKHFVSFVKKQYCPSTIGEDDIVIPFSRIHLLSGIVTLDVTDLDLAANEQGHWVMVTGLPDELPIFFFSVTAPTPDKPTMLINHSSNVADRMRCWSSHPASVSLFPLNRLPSVLLN